MPRRPWPRTRSSRRPSARRFRRHPTLTVNPRNDHCFGCHSRSGRIALCYEGWNELREETGDNAAPDRREEGPRFRAKRRKLDDGRFVEKIVADVHHERGMECIDCHTANELMGAGAEVAEEEPAAARRLRGLPRGASSSRWRRSSSTRSRRLLHKLRGWTLAPGQTHGHDARRRAAGERGGRGGQGREAAAQAHRRGAAAQGPRQPRARRARATSGSPARVATRRGRRAATPATPSSTRRTRASTTRRRSG